MFLPVANIYLLAARNFATCMQAKHYVKFQAQNCRIPNQNPFLKFACRNFIDEISKFQR